MKLTFEALDTLFFRDGRPFSMGEDSYAEGIFPPLPSTVRGALRSYWLAQQLDSKNADPIQLAKASGVVSLSYFGLGISGEPVFPAPLDLFWDSEQKIAKPMELISKNSFASSSPDEIEYLFKAKGNGKTTSVAGFLLNSDAMKDYLEGDDKEGFTTIRLADYITKEPKIGIGRDNETHLVKDGLLFRLQATRLQGAAGHALQMLVEADGINPLPHETILPLGGERKNIAAKPATFELPARPIIKGRFLKIYLLTPGLFEQWHPIHLATQFPGLQLRAAAIGRPVAVGGWDMAKNEPKSMRKAAPAGSVYFFEAKDEAQANLVCQTLHGKSICGLEDAKDGFGLCLISQPFENPKN